MHIQKAPFISPNSPKAQQSHKRRGRLFWSKAIKEFEESPLSLKDFCAERTLAVSTFHGWHRRLFPDKSLTQNSQRKQIQNQRQFLPVCVTSPEIPSQEVKNSVSSVLESPVSSLPNSSGLALFLNEHLKVSIDRDFHGPTLQRLVQICSPTGPETC